MIQYRIFNNKKISMKNIDYADKAKRSLLIYSGILALLMMFTNIAISLNGNHLYQDSAVTLPMALFTLVFLYYVYYHITSKNLLAKIRYGRFVAHVVSYLIINISFHLHAFILFAQNSPAIRGDQYFALSSDWFGVLFGMSTFWGIGLLIHMIASIANRGFEELPRS